MASMPILSDWGGPAVNDYTTAYWDRRKLRRFRCVSLKRSKLLITALLPIGPSRAPYTHLLQTATRTPDVRCCRIGGAAVPGKSKAATASACRRSPCSSQQNRHAAGDVNPDAECSRNYTVGRKSARALADHHVTIGTRVTCGNVPEGSRRQSNGPIKRLAR